MGLFIYRCNKMHHIYLDQLTLPRLNWSNYGKINQKFKFHLNFYLNFKINKYSVNLIHSSVKLNYVILMFLLNFTVFPFSLHSHSYYHINTLPIYVKNILCRDLLAVMTNKNVFQMPTT